MTRGYPPSVYSEMPKLLERAGRADKGSITGLYTVLVDGDDFNEPITDTARSILDGHIMLDRKLGHKNHYPATDVLTEYVRQGLKRAISSKYFPANETTSVITLDPAVEQEIMSSVKQTEQGSYLSLDPDRIKAIIKSVETEIGKLESLGKSAIIITSPIVRMYFKKMTEDYFKDLIVLSYNEVESNVELQSVGMVTA